MITNKPRLSYEQVCETGINLCHRKSKERRKHYCIQHERDGLTENLENQNTHLGPSQITFTSVKYKHVYQTHMQTALCKSTIKSDPPHLNPIPLVC